MRSKPVSLEEEGATRAAPSAVCPTASSAMS
jgi:hypothetical protein